MRRAAPLGSGRRSVQPVLQHVEVEGAELDGAEVVGAVVDLVEHLLVVPGAAAVDQLGGAHQRPAVDVRQAVGRHQVALRREIVEVAEGEAEGVANLAVGVGQPRHGQVRVPHVLPEIHRGDPQAQDFSAVFLPDLLRGDNVAERLGHGPALGVQHPAGGGHLPVGHPVPNAHAHQQRAVEPAAILVARFHIFVGGPGQLLAVPQHGQVAGAGVEPHIEDVGLLAEGGATAARAVRAGGQQLAGRPQVPGVGRFPAKNLHRVAQRGDVGQPLAALLAIKSDDGHAPKALPRDAPVWAHGDHVEDAALAPGRRPLHLGDFLQRAAPQVVALHADEPLLGGAEDGGVMATPAVRIGMFQRLGAQQAPVPAQDLDNGGVGLEHLLPGQPGAGLGGEAAGLVHGTEDGQAVLLADYVIFVAVSRRRVHDAAALFQRHVRAQDHRNVAVQEGVAEAQPLQLLALRFGAHRAPFQSGFLGRQAGQLGGQQVGVAVLGLADHVVEVRVHGQRHAGRQRPRRGGPDDRRQIRPEAFRIVLGLRVGHPDRGAAVVLVLDLGFGQRRLVRDAPVHRFHALVHISFFQEGDEGAGDGGLVFGAHGQVGLVPLAEDPQALEFVALDSNVLLGKTPAGLAEFVRRHLRLPRPQFLVHAVFDGQAVAIPAGHIGRVIAGHVPRFDDEVLDDLVLGRAQVDGAVGVRRPVVQDEARGAAPPLANPLVELLPLPPFQHLRLALRQVGLHREIGARQVEGILQLERGSHLCSVDER